MEWLLEDVPIKNVLQGLGGGREMVTSGLVRDDVGRIRRGWEVVDRNLDKAVDLLDRACRGGYSASCDVVGPLLHGACVRGDGDSCVALAKLAARP